MMSFLVNDATYEWSLNYFGSRMVSVTDVGNLTILLLNLETFQTTLAIFLPKHLATNGEFFLIYLATFNKCLAVNTSLESS